MPRGPSDASAGASSPRPSREARSALLHSAAGPARSGRRARPGRGREVLRAARTPPDGEDLGPAGAADRLNADGYRCVYVNVEVGADGPRGRRTGHAYGAGTAGVPGADDPGRRVPGRRLSGSAGAIRAARRVAGGVDALGRDRRDAAGAADRRDRHADRRFAAGRAAAVADGVPPAPARLSAERGPVRGAGLPDPFRLGERDHRRGRRVQRQGGVLAAGGLLAGRGPGPARAAHGRDGTGVHGRGPGTRVGADPGAAVAGERAGG